MFYEWIAVLKLVGCMFAVGFIIERLMPGVRKGPISNILFNSIYGMFCLFLAVSLIPWLGALTAPIAASFNHKIHIEFPDGWLGSLLAQATFLCAPSMGAL